MAAFLGGAVALVFGYFAVFLFLPPGRPRWARTLAVIALGAGLGIGATSVLFFLSLAAGIGSPWPVLGVASAGALGLYLASRHPKLDQKPIEPVEAASGFRWNWLLAMALAVVLLVAGSGLIELAQARPDGDWDAWAIWNLRARFLTGPGDSWKHAISPLLVHTHPHYPLLTSAWVAWLSKLAGEPSPLIPEWTAFLFAVATIALLVASVALLRGTTAALASGLILLAATGFVLPVASQYADIPLAFYYLASVALLVAAPGASTVALAGAFASLAAWTKSEGLSFALCLLVAHLVMRRGRFWQALLAGAAPGMLFVAGFRLAVPSMDSIFQQGAAEVLHKALDWGRYAVILKQAALELVRFGSPISHPLLMLGVVAFALGWRLPARDRPAALTAAAALALTFASYFAVFVVAPEDLTWRLETALGRLYAQLWPAALFVAFLMLGRAAPAKEAVMVAADRKSPPHRKRAQAKAKRP